jgi:RimJ/RimL family protein N-acetyltransferase
MSLIAEVGENGEKRVAALMNFVQTKADNRGEIAIVVEDAYQNRGLGSAMLSCLYELAKHRKVKKFIADIDAGNRRVFHLIKRSGLPCRISIDQGVAHAELETDPDRSS